VSDEAAIVYDAHPHNVVRQGLSKFTKTWAMIMTISKMSLFPSILLGFLFTSPNIKQVSNGMP
jgi:hypothetical protein